MISRPRRVSTNTYTLLFISSFYYLKVRRFPKKFPTKDVRLRQVGKVKIKFTARSRQRSARWKPNSPPDHDKVGKMKTKFIVRLQSDKSARWKPTSPPDHDENRIHRLILRKVDKVKTKIHCSTNSQDALIWSIHRPIIKQQIDRKWRTDSLYDLDRNDRPTKVKMWFT